MRALLLAALLLPLTPTPVRAECRPEPITPNTPSGIAGCEIFGEGTASHYGPGSGVAMNFCTYGLRTTEGCGEVWITSLQTGIRVRAPVVDFCDCYVGSDRFRIVDLQWGVLAALGLDPRQGLYPVTVLPASASSPAPEGGPPSLPDTALSR